MFGDHSSGLIAVLEAARPGRYDSATGAVFPASSPAQTKPATRTPFAAAVASPPAAAPIAPPAASRSSVAPIAPAVAAPAPPPKPLTEAERVAAIDALALPGCDLVAEDCKSDQAVTPAIAATRILVAYRANQAIARGDTAAAMTDLRREWESASPSMRSTFGAFDAFAGYRRGVATGGIRESRRTSSLARRAVSAPPTNLAKIPDQARAEWNASAELQAEFPEVGDYVAFRKADADGRCWIYGNV